MRVAAQLGVSFGPAQRGGGSVWRGHRENKTGVLLTRLRWMAALFEVVAVGDNGGRSGQGASGELAYQNSARLLYLAPAATGATC
jgi:hypothetical protein